MEQQRLPLPPLPPPPQPQANQQRWNNGINSLIMHDAILSKVEKNFVDMFKKFNSMDSQSNVYS